MQNKRNGPDDKSSSPHSILSGCCASSGMVLPDIAVAMTRFLPDHKNALNLIIN